MCDARPSARRQEDDPPPREAVPGALPLGIAVVAAYEETEICLHPGDHLALCTDGLLEARSQAGELYGFDRLRTLFAGRPTAEEAKEAAVAFGQDDDITVLTLTCLPVQQTSSALLQPTVLAPA